MENEVSSLLKQAGFGFKKQLGQNFITDKNLLFSIVKEAGVCREDTIVEIGCGAGTLTCVLAQTAKRVIGYEIDKSLKEVLAQTLKGLNNVEVAFGDFLKADLSELYKNIGEYSVVANIPYYVTTPIIMKLMEEGLGCRKICVMVQQEVAARLCAKEGTAEYGAITANIALSASARIIKKVPKEAFTPRPKVDSAVVLLKIQKGRLPVISPQMYRRTVTAAFLSRRKTLENNLVNYFNLPRESVKKILFDCGIAEKARGETLSPEVLANLSNRLYNVLG